MTFFPPLRSHWLARVVAVVAAAFLAGLPMGAAGAQSGDVVRVVEVSGPIDARAVDFVTGEIEAAGSQLVVLAIDSAGALDGRVAELVDLVGDAPVPVAVWVGPAPARAFGGAAQLLAAAPIRAAAPGTVVGHLHPTVTGRQGAGPDPVIARYPAVPASLVTGRTAVDEPIPGLVDEVVPSVGQLIVGLDGRAVPTRAGTITLATARPAADGTGPEPAVTVVFTDGPLLDRVLRAAATPEAAFFFLVTGLALVVFEFYAAGVGVMGAVAAACLMLAGYGIGVLPVRWWAVAAVVLGLVAYTADFQRNDLGWRSVVGTLLLAAGGGGLVDAAPHFAPSWWVVAAVIAGAALFFGVGMTAVVRSRFSTRTIGRSHLVGRIGRAESDFDPHGVVSLSGARWRATSTRAARIRAGMEVEVVGVSGITLDVDPVDARATISE